MLESLRRRIEALANGATNAWQALVTSRVLWKGCVEAVRDAEKGDASVGSSLEEIWNCLQETRAAAAIPTAQATLRETLTRFGNSEADRLFGVLKGHIACARLIVAVRQHDINTFVKWLNTAVGCFLLSRSGGMQLKKLPSASWDKILDEAFNALQNNGLPVHECRDLTWKLLGRSPAKAEHTIEQTVLGVKGDNGYVATLTLELLPDGEGWVRHPDVLLLPCDDAFQSALVNTTPPPCEGLRASKGAVRWKLARDNNGPIEATGGSIGGAVATALRTLFNNEWNPSYISISATVDPCGAFNRVDNILDKIIALALSKEAETYGLTVLFVANNQDGVPHMGEKVNYVLLPPREGMVGVGIPSNESRSPESVIVMRASSVSDAVEKWTELHSRTVLNLLKRPLIIAEYLLGGTLLFRATMAIVLVGSWYYLDGYWFWEKCWFVLCMLWLTLGILLVRWRIVKKGQSKIAISLPPESKCSLEDWSSMTSIAGGDCLRARWRNEYKWLKSLFDRETSDKNEHLRLTDLPWLWRKRLSYWISLVVFLALLVFLLSPLQYELAELLPPWAPAAFLGGTSYIWGEEYSEPVSVTTEQGGARTLRAKVGSFGRISLSVVDKPRTRRFLRIKVTKEQEVYCLLRSNPELPGKEVIVVPIRRARATFYYGVGQTDMWWSITLRVEILDHSHDVLQKATLYGHRRIPPRPR